MSSDPTPVVEVVNDSVAVKLQELGVEPDMVFKIKALGATSVDDLANLTESDLTGVGMPVLKVRALLKKLVPVSVAPALAPAAFTMTNFNVLPTVPDDESWLKALKVGGVLKFSSTTVVGTVSAALANRVGLYDLPKRISAAMESFAESLEEPVSADFFEMQRMLTERSYAEVFSAMPGATGRFASQARKNALLTKLDQNLWTALTSFHGQLSNWMDSWQKGMANPAMMMSAIASLAGGGGMMAPGMMAPPPTDGLRDAAESVIAEINKIFAGTGILVATALAYDAQQIRKVLEDPNLPAHIGAVNRDQMLKQLGVAVASDYPRLEQNLKQYALGVIELPNVTAGQVELAYITALFQLGNSITWDKLNLNSSTRSTGKITGIGGKRHTDIEDNDL